jgi:hypothetical protein
MKEQEEAAAGSSRRKQQEEATLGTVQCESSQECQVVEVSDRGGDGAAQFIVAEVSAVDI